MQNPGADTPDFARDTMTVLAHWSKEGYRWILWGNVLIALSAAGWVVVAMRLMGSPPDAVLTLLAFALAITFYTRDRLDAQEQVADGVNFPARTLWVARHQGLLRGWIQAGSAVALICVMLRPLAIFPLLAGLGFALSYTARWIPRRGRRVAWKQLPLLKMPCVALLWTILTVGTPMVVYGAWRSRSAWLVAGVVFILIMGQILLNDLRDAAGDTESGTRSLPVVVGSRWSRRIGIGLMGTAFLMALPFNQFALPLTAVYSALLLLGYRRAEDGLWRPWIEAQGVIAVLISFL